jgi:hypothetical protein
MTQPAKACWVIQIAVSSPNNQDSLVSAQRVSRRTIFIWAFFASVFETHRPRSLCHWETMEIALLLAFLAKQHGSFRATVNARLVCGGGSGLSTLKRASQAAHSYSNTQNISSIVERRILNIYGHRA